MDVVQAPGARILLADAMSAAPGVFVIPANPPEASLAAPVARFGARSTGMLPLLLERQPRAPSPWEATSQPAAECNRLVPGDVNDGMEEDGRDALPGDRLAARIERLKLGVRNGYGRHREGSGDRHPMAWLFVVSRVLVLRVPHPEFPRGDLPPEWHAAVLRSLDPAEQIFIRPR